MVYQDLLDAANSGSASPSGDEDAICFERVEVAQIYDRVIFVKRGVVEAALWQTANQRHLSAFETWFSAITSTSSLTLMTFTGGFIPASNASALLF